MVKSAYKAIKAVQPRDVVVTGATTGNNYAFIEQLYAHGLKGHFDAIGTHTDTACLVDGPSRMYREPDGRLGRYIFSSYRETYEVMKRNGDGGKQIWMTELGWNTQDHSPGSCTTGVYAGQEAARRHRGRPGALPHGGLPVPAERPVHRRRLLVRPAGHPDQQVRRRLRPVPPQRQREARRGRVQGALARDHAQVVRRDHRRLRAAVRRQGAAGRPRLPQGDGDRRQGHRRRRRGHQGHRAADRRQVLPLLRRRPREDADPLGVARVAQRHVAQADVHRRGRRRQRGEHEPDGQEGPPPPEGRDGGHGRRHARGRDAPSASPAA